MVGAADMKSSREPVMTETGREGGPGDMEKLNKNKNGTKMAEINLYFL